MDTLNGHTYNDNLRKLPNEYGDVSIMYSKRSVLEISDHWNMERKGQNHIWIDVCTAYQIIWATSWENLFLPCANNKDADPRSLISAFVVRCLSSIIPLVSAPELWSLYLASVAESTLVANSEDRFSRDEAHIKTCQRKLGKCLPLTVRMYLWLAQIPRLQLFWNLRSSEDKRIINISIIWGSTKRFWKLQ